MMRGQKIFQDAQTVVVPGPAATRPTFTDPRLCAAIVDRLTFGGNIIEPGSDSYRLAHIKARRQATAAS